MIVGELEDILALLPQDMAVFLRSSGGCKHIDRVVKQNKWHFRPRWVDDAMRASGTPVVVLPDGAHPPALVLEASYSAPMWCSAWADEVPFIVEGRWPAKAARRG